ncbi:RNA-directed DNA polymerase [Lichtheimia hyalospora FSU 10163]|nr:RNA-directed DNA polymerase [Lichtheimia hyalospora FSU 10163]
MKKYNQVYGEWPVVTFLDIKAAYDSVDRDIIWHHLQANIPYRLFLLCRHLFEDVHVSIILKNVQSRFARPKRGVLQGSIINPLLYAVFIDILPKQLRSALHFSTRPTIIRHTPQDHLTEAECQHLSYHRPLTGGRPPRRPDTSYLLLNALLYADDVAIIGSSEDMISLLSAAERHSMDAGYRWHPEKCKSINAPSHTILQLY